ncbi:uncharacterized protein LOC113870232 [Abrus precatorius]|uniref:Uncharacterized protein LOC113870232 n=1 Tax=Abrus precatorius TaxID=3816 RepID=A0A8B8M264_ABRPR|nr:uncharacterized protein LOC113870232 [Abrus precatorius]
MDLSRFFKPKTANSPTQTSQKPSALPKSNQVVSATKGVTDAFSGVTKHVSNSFKNLGALNIQAGIGYGIGFGHGFGLGLSMRSGVWSQIQSRIAVTMTNMMMKFGLFRSLPFSQGALPASLKSAQSKVTTDQISAESIMQLATKSADQISSGSVMQLATKSASHISEGLVGSQPTKIDLAFQNKALKSGQTEKVISNLPQNPSLKGEGGLDEAAGRLQPEDKILQTVLKQRLLIEELVEENERLQQILQVKDQKTPSSKLQASFSSGTIKKRDFNIKILDLIIRFVWFVDSNPQKLPPSEVQEKTTGGSRPPGDNADARSIAAPIKDATITKLLPRTNALLGLEGTSVSDEGSPVEGDGDGADDGEEGALAGAEGEGGGDMAVGPGLGAELGPGFWAELGESCGGETGEEEGGGVVGAIWGAGEGACAVDIASKYTEMVSTSMARASAMGEKEGTENGMVLKRNRVQSN